MLTAGESKVLDWLDSRLGPAWEIYVQPHLNGLRPDFVLLHPAGRTLVVEVKDWTFDDWAITWTPRGSAAPIPTAERDGRRLVQRNPVEQVQDYAVEISATRSGRTGSTPARC